MKIFNEYKFFKNIDDFKNICFLNKIGLLNENDLIKLQIIDDIINIQNAKLIVMNCIQNLSSVIEEKKKQLSKFEKVRADLLAIGVSVVYGEENPKDKEPKKKTTNNYKNDRVSAKQTKEEKKFHKRPPPPPPPPPIIESRQVGIAGNI